jgi:hypothetical protein
MGLLKVNFNKYNLDDRFKNIADGVTAFCIFGGPSVENVVEIDNLIKNNFTVVVNNGIKFHKPDMFVSADNVIVREFFEDNEFTVHRFTGGKLFKNASNFSYDEKPIVIQGKSHLVKDENMMKILVSNDFPCYNFNFTTGQIYKQNAYDYCKRVKNTWVVKEYRSETNENWPTLSPQWENSLTEYGKDMNNIYPGGNIASIVFQILYYMGFSKVITVGIGDSGSSKGNLQHHLDKEENEFEWDAYEINSIPIHNEMWSGSRELKTLHGGEILNKYGEFHTADYDELLNTKNKIKKDNLIKKIKEISNE